VNFGFQDKHGFLWFATDNGLSRFDGYSFVNFNASNLSGLPSSKVVSLCEDNDGNIWIGTQEGIGILNTKTYKITRVFNHTNVSSSLKSSSICEILMDDSKRIWVTTVDGFLHLYKGNGVFKHLKNPLHHEGRFGRLPNITCYKNSVYLTNLQEGVFEINALFEVKFIGGKNLSTHNGIITSARGIGVVVAAKEGFFRIDSKTRKLKPVFPFFGAETYMLCEDHLGDYWAIQHDRKRLNYYSKDDHQLIEWTDLVFNSHDNVHMTYLFEDSSNNVWICTNKGVYKLSNERKSFRSILRLDQYKAPNYIPSYRGMMEDEDGTLFIGGYSGLFRKEVDGNINRLFSNVIPYTPYLLVQKNKKELWALCEGYGIITVDKKTGKVTQYHDPFAITEDYKGIYLKSGILARDGKFWLGSYAGVIRFDPKTERYYKQKLTFGKYDFTVDFLVTQIDQDEKGNLWFASNEGVFVFTEKGKPLYHYHENARSPYKLPFNDVKCMLTDHLNQHWFGSASNGIVCVSGKTKRHLTVKNHLSDNGIAGMLDDDKGHIWITTNKGVSVYSHATGKIKGYYIENGLSDNEFNHASLLKTRNGKLYFGSINGVNIYNPQASGSRLNKKGKLVVSLVELPQENNVKSIQFNDRNIRKGIHLAPNMGHLYLEFFVDDYVRSEKNTFEYKLEGYDRKWQAIGEQNHIRFTGLAPGDYVLRIRATSSKGIPAINQLTIPLLVDQVFYKTWWFMLLMMLGTISLITYIFYVRFQRLKAVSDLRTSIASDIHDNLGSSLTVIAMESEILEEDATPEQKVLFREIAMSCRNAISSMRDMVWSIDERNASVQNLFDKCNEHAHQLLDLAKIPCHFEIDQRLLNLNLTALDRQELLFIFKEAIVNALKYGDGTGVKITMKKSNNVFLFSVSNQVEETVTFRNAGLGLRNIRRRAAKIGATVDFNLEDGFEMCLQFPIQRKFSIFGRS
jgi:ligand-binding sensor domain-containing protein/two-component sensor histidine kinase